MADGQLKKVAASEFRRQVVREECVRRASPPPPPDESDDSNDGPDNDGDTSIGGDGGGGDDDVDSCPPDGPVTESDPANPGQFRVIGWMSNCKFIPAE